MAVTASMDFHTTQRRAVIVALVLQRGKLKSGGGGAAEGIPSRCPDAKGWPSSHPVSVKKGIPT